MPFSKCLSIALVLPLSMFLARQCHRCSSKCLSVVFADKMGVLANTFCTLCSLLSSWCRLIHFPPRPIFCIFRRLHVTAPMTTIILPKHQIARMPCNMIPLRILNFEIDVLCGWVCFELNWIEFNQIESSTCSNMATCRDNKSATWTRAHVHKPSQV